MTSILMSHMMITKNLQNDVQSIFTNFEDLIKHQIDVNICEPQYVNLLIFCEPLP